MPQNQPSFDPGSLQARLSEAVPLPIWAHWRPLLAALVLVVGGGYWALQSSDGPTSSGQPLEATLPRAQPAPPTPPPGATPNGEAVVQAAGAVADPGVYRVPSGGRVGDVVDEAGGLSSDADLDRINLAAKVADGQRIYLIRKGQQAAPEAVGAGASGSGEQSSGGGGESGGLVDLNTATVEQLDKLPGVGPATAKLIVDHRTKSGPFRTVNNLEKVKGIGPAKFEQIRPLAKV